MEASKSQLDRQEHPDLDLQPDTKGIGEFLDLDEAILRAQGREVELGRSFSWFGALGLAFR